MDLDTMTSKERAQDDVDYAYVNLTSALRRSVEILDRDHSAGTVAERSAWDGIFQRRYDQARANLARVQAGGHSSPAIHGAE